MQERFACSLGNVKLWRSAVRKVTSSARLNALKKDEVNIGNAIQQLKLNIRSLTNTRYDKPLKDDFLHSKDRRLRYAKRTLLVEGVRALGDSLRLGARLKRLCVTMDSILTELPLPKASQFIVSSSKELETQAPSNDERLNALARFVLQGNLLKISHDDLRILSDTKTPAGVVAVCEMPAWEWSDVERSVSQPSVIGQRSFPVSVICDNLRDPGNVGSLIRTAAALRCVSIVFTKGCVDVWEPKVVRSAAGAHFLVPLFTRFDWNDIDTLWPTDSIVLAADAQSDTNGSLPLWNMPVFAQPHAGGKSAHRVALVLGGETAGISAEARAFVDKRVAAARSSGLPQAACGGVLHIPIDSRIDSLNSATAASIILFELNRQFVSLN